MNGPYKKEDGSIRSLIVGHTKDMSEAVEKIKLLSSPHDLSAATYQIYDESHTIGNALRWMLMKDPKVEFCGYSAPHPSENVINVRIQMYDKLSSLETLIAALANLDKVCETIEDQYLISLRDDKFERWEEKSWKDVDFL